MAAPWVVNQSALQFMAFQVYGPNHNFTTPELFITDNQDADWNYGTVPFQQGTTATGSLSFTVAAMDNPAGNTNQQWDVILQDGSANNLLNVSIYASTSNYIWFQLQGTNPAPTQYTNNFANHLVNVTFTGNVANLYVDGALEVGSVTYSGGIAAQLRVETTVATHGGEAYFDNFTVRANNPPSTPTLASIDPNPDYASNLYLSWNSAAGATSYTVYRNSSAITSTVNQTPLGTTTDVFFVDNAVPVGTSWYAVVASNSSGNSDVSNTVNVTVVNYPVAWVDSFDTDTIGIPPSGWDTSLLGQCH